MLHNLTRFLRAAAAFMGTLGAAYSATWTPINNDLPSRNSGITAIAIDRNTPSTLYAVSNRRTIYKSTDGAATWRMVSGIVGVSSLAITPDSSIYAATSQGVMRNTDGGGSWTVLSNGIDPTTPWITALTVDPSMLSTIYVLNTSKLLKSTDGGGSWSVLYDFGPRAFPGSLVVDPITPSTMYVMNGIGGTIFKSTDGGVSWTQIRGATFNTGFAADAMPLAIDPTDHTTLYAGSFAAFGVPTPQGQPGFGTISKSSDGGSTWKTITAGIPSDAFVRSLAVDSANPGVIYAGYVRSGGGGVLKSTDAGESWQEMYTVSGTPSGSFIVGVAVGPDAVYAGYSDFGSGGRRPTTDGRWGLDVEPSECRDAFLFSAGAIERSCWSGCDLCRWSGTVQDRRWRRYLDSREFAAHWHESPVRLRRHRRVDSLHGGRFHQSRRVVRQHDAAGRVCSTTK
jgi:photosystem II stability/assembly factor-like uncharacterized protein